MIRVNYVCHWMGTKLPEQLQGEGPFDISPEFLTELTAKHDVAFMHVRDEGGLLLALDDPGRKFRQR